MIEKHVQCSIAEARDGLDHLLTATKRWHDALEAGDPVEADRWQIEASRRVKQAQSTTQTASLLKRQADVGMLHADRDGNITAGLARPTCEGARLTVSRETG